MGLFFAYILKSAICLALFYLFYRLLLSKETFHRFNLYHPNIEQKSAISCPLFSSPSLIPHHNSCDQHLVSGTFPFHKAIIVTTLYATQFLWIECMAPIHVTLKSERLYRYSI